MKCRFSEHGFTCQQWHRDRLCNVKGPLVVLIVAPGKGNDESRVRYAFHERENPFRDETSGGPPMISPAWRRNR
jgi:hypothetical protein